MPTVDAAIDALNAGQPDDAVRLARRITVLTPRSAVGWKVLAAAQAAQNDWPRALRTYARAEALNAHDWEFLNNYGNALKTIGRPGEAVEQYRRSIRRNPVALPPRYNLGLVFIDLGRFSEAESALMDALALAPDHGLAHLNLGNVLNVQGRLREAEQHYRSALADLDGDERLHNNLGLCLRRQHRYAEAEFHFRHALELNPNYATTYSNLADFMAMHGFMDEAVTLLRHAITLEPRYAEAWSNLLFTLSHTDISPEQLLAEHKAFGDRFEVPLLNASHSLTPPSRREDHPLRLGFVSADLRDHPVVRYLRPALNELSQDPNLELFAYNNNAQQDAETDRYKQQFHHWRDVTHLSDDSLASLIRRDRIDILFDLAGHSGHNRLLTFARKPAPVQISWIGYVGTTGLQSMDYFIADEHLVPPSMECQFTERILRVPTTTTFGPCSTAPAVNELPALTTGIFTFACLARVNKLNRKLIATWSEILRRTPMSRLMLVTMSDGKPPQPVVDWFAEEGIDPSRLWFVNPRSTEDVLALHHHIDLALDTFPYNGSTTNNHALWMGVPTLTFPGKTPSGRMTNSLNLHTGLKDFLGEDVIQYVSLACRHGNQPSVLATLRPTLRERLATSPVCDHRSGAAAVVQALRSIKFLQ